MQSIKKLFILVLSLLLFTSLANAAEAPISPQTGKVIGYLPGWKSPLPTPQDLKNAGYTHIIIAFGLFSTDSPGQVVTAFPTVTKNYIARLQLAGIKVLFSLGGADSNLPNATVNFDQVLQLASSPAQFQKDLTASIENVITTYNFDGVDFDIEQGFSATAGESFQHPTGDIEALANVINQLHADHPQLLLSLVPQSDNIAATNSFGNPWGTYSSLIMQTSQALSWVGIQLYNTGCANGIDDVCYANTGTGQDFSVAMATDLLENWPATDAGRPTGFLPYLGILKPSQVVLGYPVVDNNGNSDGLPATPPSIIKKAIQCLVSGQNCGQYTPPRQYPGIGGVFDWEVTYDANNSYQFAKQLNPCVLRGQCS